MGAVHAPQTTYTILCPRCQQGSFVVTLTPFAGGLLGRGKCTRCGGWQEATSDQVVIESIHCALTTLQGPLTQPSYD